MKFFEYLAAGCPVVSTALPALRGYAHVALLAGSHEEFVEALESVLRGGGPKLAVRLAVASDHTYERRTERMFELMESR
jgi:hypothetical protein